MSEKLRLTVSGMTCGGCEKAVTRTLGQIGGVSVVNASHHAGQVDVTYDERLVTPAMLRTAIEGLGYRVEP